MNLPAPFARATDIARAVATGVTTARAVTEAALTRLAAVDPDINAFTDVTCMRALAEADAVDAARARGAPPGPLAGVPYAVKNLFDVEGLATRAGSRINRERAPAVRDATLVERMHAAGAVLLGTLNMGEFAYDFTGENAHDGPACNPHDRARMTGGSSSGSGAATAAGLAPISLGSDTNGSLRVPAALCGVFSLKPTYGRLGRGGSFPFVDSLDHVGPLARTVADLALAFDVLQGPDPRDHACTARPCAPLSCALDEGVAGLRVGVLGGWFTDNAGAAARAALERAAALPGIERRRIVLEGAPAGRAAAFLITNAESAAFHLARLRARPHDFDPDTRDRFLAGALLPAAWLVEAQRVRRWWAGRLAAAFADLDLILAPATPVPAPKIGQRTLEIGGREVALRPSLGLLAQPFSCAGLPVVTVPVFAAGGSPLGVQVIAPPWREAVALRAARALEREGIAVAHPPRAGQGGR